MSWTDVENPTEEDIRLMAQGRPFHPLNLEDCLSKRQLPKIEDHQSYVFVLLHFPAYEDRHSGIVPTQLSIFLGNDYLVTLHQSGLRALREVFLSCKEDAARREAIMGRSVAELLYRIIDRLVDDVFPILDDLMNKLELIEDRVYDEEVFAAREIGQLRREITALRRIVSPLRRLVSELGVKIQRFDSSKELTIYFGDVGDHVARAWETLEEAKENVDIYAETDHILGNQKLNKVLALLTIVFTLTIPATLVGTLYGMNVPLPGDIETGPWTFLGPYTSFLVLLLVSVVPAIVMAEYFHRLGWF